MNAYYVPHTNCLALSLNLVTPYWGGYCYYLCCIDEEKEAQRMEISF